MPPPDPNLPSDPGSSVQFHGHGSYEARWARLKHLLSEVHNEYSRTKVELEKVKVELRQKEMELQECRDQIPRAIDTFQVSDSQILDAFVLIRDSLCNWIEALPEINGFEGSWKRIDWKMKSGTSSGLLQLQVGLQGPLDSVQTEIMERDIFRIIWENIFEHTLPGATHGQQLLLDKHMDQVRLLMPPKGKLMRTNQSETRTMLKYGCQTQRLSSPGDQTPTGNLPKPISINSRSIYA